MGKTLEDACEARTRVPVGFDVFAVLGGNAAERMANPRVTNSHYRERCHEGRRHAPTPTLCRDTRPPTRRSARGNALLQAEDG
jgi:hypothetical protein